MVQRNTWHSNKNGLPRTNAFPQGGCSWAMTPFWRLLVSGTSKPQCKWEANYHTQPSPKFFMFQKWRIVSFPWVDSFLKVSKWSLTRMVVRLTMFKKLLWRKHKRTRTCTFLMWRCRRTQRTLQILWMKVQGLRSWMPWWMAWIWKKFHCTMCVKFAWKENIKGHFFLKMKQQGFLSFWNLCITMCGDRWRPHHVVEHDTLSLSSTTF